MCIRQRRAAALVLLVAAFANLVAATQPPGFPQQLTVEYAKGRHASAEYYVTDPAVVEEACRAAGAPSMLEPLAQQEHRHRRQQHRRLIKHQMDESQHGSVQQQQGSVELQVQPSEGAKQPTGAGNLTLLMIGDLNRTGEGLASVCNKLAYAKRHGYTLHLTTFTHHCGRSDIIVCFIMKVAALLAYLKASQAPWVWFIDQDTLIVNQKRRLEDVIQHWSQGSPDVNLMLTERCGIMNTGSLILRPSPWTTHLFTYVLDMSSKLLQGDPSLNQDLPLLCKPVQGQRICPDQDVLNHLLSTQPSYSKYVRLVPASEINAVAPEVIVDIGFEHVLASTAAEAHFRLKQRRTTAGAADTEAEGPKEGRQSSTKAVLGSPVAVQDGGTQAVQDGSTAGLSGTPWLNVTQQPLGIGSTPRVTCTAKDALNEHSLLVHFAGGSRNKRLFSKYLKSSRL